MLLGFTTFQAGLYSGHSEAAAENLTYLDISNDMIAQGESLKDSIQGSGGWTGVGLLDAMISGGYNTLKIVFGLDDIITSFITDAGTALGIPSAYIGIILAAIIMSITLAIISYIISVRI